MPAELLHAARWRTVLVDRWAFEEGILHLEGRATLKAVERVASSRAGRDGRVLLLGDNMAVVLACSRSRARDVKLLAMIRRAAARSSGRGLRFSYRWTPSEFNSSDEGVRLFVKEYEANKCATHLLPDGRASPLGADKSDGGQGPGGPRPEFRRISPRIAPRNEPGAWETAQRRSQEPGGPQPDSVSPRDSPFHSASPEPSGFNDETSMRPLGLVASPGPLGLAWGALGMRARSSNSCFLSCAVFGASWASLGGSWAILCEPWDFLGRFGRS